MDGGQIGHDKTRFTLARSSNGGVRLLGTWETIDANITLLLAEGIKPFILCTVSEKNYRDLQSFVEYTISRRIGFRLSLIKDGYTYAKSDVESNILGTLVEVYEWLGRNMPVDMPIERYARFAEWDPAVKKAAVCGTCKSTAAIDQQGQVATCQMRMDKPHGNVHNESLTSIFERMTAAKENQYLAYTRDKTGDCSNCYWKYTCAGGCPEHTRMAMGTANAPSPWCHLYRSFYPHYLRAIARQIKAGVERS
jgi:uncharacterized protein